MSLELPHKLKNGEKFKSIGDKIQSIFKAQAEKTILTIEKDTEE